MILHGDLKQKPVQCEQAWDVGVFSRTEAGAIIACGMKGSNAGTAASRAFALQIKSGSFRHNRTRP
ncbi:hypothetical protein GCM10022212_02520 [Actimicrobium antarcticum]|uniref:Uncharacterized protein n=1 Tax=Actimicrobium antarcticum TaxID=1051899 RepID=A0ABP7SJK0_9BURK